MKLPFSFGKKEENQYYLALLLQDEKIGAVVFEELNGKIHIAEQAEQHFDTSLEEAEFEELLDTIDKAVSTAEASIPETIQTQKTVFGVKQDWIEEGKIKKSYLVKLKKICDELSLQPIGFLVFTEAIVHLLQQEEGAPVSALLIEIGRKIIDISVVRAGRIIETKQIDFAEPIPQTVDEALKHFKNIEILPSRIILFDSENNEKITQEFTGHSWSRGLPFLHVPQTTVLPPNFDTKGVLYGTATQMGFAVEERELEESKGTKDTKETKVETNEELEESNAVEKPAVTENTENSTESTEIKSSVTPVDTSVSSVNADYFGFVANGDVAKTAQKTPQSIKHRTKKDIPDEVIEESIEEIPEEVKEEETEEQKPNAGLGVNAMLLMEGIRKGFKNVISRKKAARNSQIEMRNEKGKMNKLLFIIPCILILGILLLLAYIFGEKATVMIHVNPKNIQNQQDVTFAIDGQNDFSKNIIAAQTVPIEESGTQSTDATGTKKVGTTAKGQVTIFSRLTDTTDIPKGSLMTSSNGLQFTLDNSVHIASFSGDTSDPSVNVSNVSVTAKDIGTSYNLPSGTKLAISGLDKSDVSAKNDSPFSGGTQKDVTVVDQKDLDKVVNDLTTNLGDKAKSELNSKIGNDRQLLPAFTKQDVSKKTFDKKIGDETKKITLDGTITYQGASYSKNDITDFAKQSMKDKIPTDSNLTNNGVLADVSDIKQDQGSISAKLDMKASLAPKFDAGQIAKDITGKSFSTVMDYLKNKPQASDISIQLHPNLPFLPKFLPRISKNIDVVITTQ